MASLIHELENNEALLLLFLTGELPPEDRLEVEQMLAADAGLSAELVRLQSEYAGAMGVLARLDSDRSAIPAENHAVRQAMRAMKQWQVDRLTRQPVIIPPARRKIPVWVYPLASMAALIIGTIAWWGFGGQFLHVSIPPSASNNPVPDQGAATSVLPTTEEVTTATPLSDSLSSDAPSSDPSSIIADAETQASSLVARSESVSVTSDIFLTEANP